MINVLREPFEFLHERKKLLRAPLMFVMIILGGALDFAEGSVLSPFDTLSSRVSSCLF